MSVTFCVAVSECAFRDTSVFPQWNQGAWVEWSVAAEDHEEAAIAVNKQILARLLPHEAFAACIWREGEETSKARKFWFFNLFVSEHQPSTEEQQALRIAELEAELASCKAELQQAQAEAAAQKERAFDAELQRQLGWLPEQPGLPFAHSGVSVPEPGMMRFENVVLNRPLGQFGPGERFRAAIATNTTIRFLELTAPYEWRCSYRAQVAMVCGELVFHESDDAAAVLQ